LAVTFVLYYTVRIITIMRKSVFREPVLLDATGASLFLHY